MRTRLWIATFGAVCIAAGWLCGQRGNEGLIGKRPRNTRDSAGEPSHLRQLRLGNGTREVIRFNPVSGESWLLSGEKWKRIADVGTLNPGEFDIHVLEGPQRTNWYVFRFDRVTGNA